MLTLPSLLNIRCKILNAHYVDAIMPLSFPALDQPVDLDLFDNSPDCIKILHLDGTIRSVNAGGTVALELDNEGQLDGIVWPSLWPGSEQARVEQAVAAGSVGERTQFLAFCPTTKQTPRWWDVVVTPMKGAAQGVAGLLVVSRDVTELVQAKEELARVNAQKDTFLATLSHELRNPLAALAMAAKVLETAHGGNAQLTRISELIERQVGVMGRLTEDLIDVSRITRGQVNLQLEEIDVRDIVHDVREQLAPMLASKRQSLRVEVPAVPARVTGDRMRLGQVLGNLVANASRYSPPQLPIEVAVTVTGEHAIVSVSDEGKGIADGMMPTLFELFSQAEASTDRKGSGIGMGLGIVKGLVDLHGGSVTAASAGLGQGSRFTVALPLAERRRSAAAA